MQYRRSEHTASLLPNGKVLVTGGSIDGYTSTNSTELYDPTTGNWTNVGNMQVELEYHAASVLKDGNVLVSGGCRDDGDPSDTAELYNSSIETFTSCDTIKNPQLSHKTFRVNKRKKISY